jgi:hypothetical protein
LRKRIEDERNYRSIEPPSSKDNIATRIASRKPSDGLRNKRRRMQIVDCFHGSIEARDPKQFGCMKSFRTPRKYIASRTIA